MGPETERYCLAEIWGQPVAYDLGTICGLRLGNNQMTEGLETTQGLRLGDNLGSETLGQPGI